MMQEVTLAPTLTAREHVALAASYYRDPLPVDETLALTGIEALADKRYGKLSAGQKRQVQFAVAIAGRPRLLFLDEPTVGLDVEARETMWRNIRRLVRRRLRDRADDPLPRRGRGARRSRGGARPRPADRRRAASTRCAPWSRASGSAAPARSRSSDIRSWPGVVDVGARCASSSQVTASDAETVVRRLLAADPALGHLEVRQASLAEAFTELTKEAA